LISIAWEMMKSPNSKDAPLAYWANYQALRLGHPEGASNLGYMHEFGIGPPVDYKKAEYWYQKTIEMGEPHSAQAEIQLARFHQLGKTGKIDLNRAKELYESALKLANGPNWSILRIQYLKEIQTGLAEIALEKSADKQSTETVPKADSRIKTQTDTIRFVSVFVSDGRASGFVVGHSSQHDADKSALATCRSFADAEDRKTCTKLVGGQGRCVGIARSPDGGFGAARGNTRADVSTGAIRGCESTGTIGCAVPPNGVSCQ
jgi:TPR repeat protein